MNAASRFIASQFKKFSSRVFTQEFTFAGQRFANVGVVFGPSDGSRIIIGAHYDTVDKDHGGEVVPGADDNASGVAGILELSRLFSQYPPQVPVEVVAFALEESLSLAPNEIGSALHAMELRRQGIDISLMIDLEMIGYFSDVPGSQKYHMDILKILYPTKGNFIALVARWNEWRVVRELKASMVGATDLPVSSISMPYALPRLADSDHSSYWRNGFPAVMITDTSFNRNPHYHTSRDSWETLDYNRMGKVIQGVFTFVANRK
jgi:Zn-dependent M28 family amino/carboxypeptidase